MVAVGILLNRPGVLHQSAQAVVEVFTALTQFIDALDPLVGLIVGVRCGNALFLILSIELLDQIAPLIVGVSRGGLPAILTAGGNLIQIVELVVHRNVVAVALQRQVAQAVIT